MAIATDATSFHAQTSSATNTVSHTCTGSNLILFAGFVGAVGADNLTTITYNSVAMTLINKVLTPTDRYVYLYYLASPATGAHNLVATMSGSTDFTEIFGSSYTGANQTRIPDSNTTNTASSATAITTTLTTVASSCWTIVMVNCSNAGTITGGTGTTTRVVDNTIPGGICDSNGPLLPGSTSLITNKGGSNGALATVMASFAAKNNGGMFLDL